MSFLQVWATWEWSALVLLNQIHLIIHHVSLCVLILYKYTLWQIKVQCWCWKVKYLLCLLDGGPRHLMKLKFSQKLLSYLQDISGNWYLSFTFYTEKHLRQTNSYSPPTLTLGLMDVTELWGASPDAVCVLGWVDRGGGAEVELSDGLSAAVVCCVEDWWGGLGGLVMRGKLLPVTEGIYITDSGNDLRPLKTQNKNWNDVAHIDCCHFSWSRHVMEFGKRKFSWYCSKKASVLSLVSAFFGVPLKLNRTT